MNVWNVLRQFLIVTIAFVLLLPIAEAANFQWEGRYNFEALTVDKPRLDSSISDKTYGLHHLILRPKIVAADGFLIRGRFDVLNQGSFSNSGLGQKLGVGPRTGAANASTDSSNSNTLTHTLASDFIAVNELYLTWLQEFGALIVGRAPLQFGLGITYNAGMGEFDHWLDNRDMIAYKIQMGNFIIMPMLGTTDEGNIGGEDDVNDYMVHLEYNNPETGLALGVFHQTRVTTQSGNDFPTGPFGAGAVSGFNSKGFEGSQNSIYVRQKVDDIHIGVEAGFTSGKAGVTNATGGEVRFNGYGVAAEVDWKPEGQELTAGIKFGAASGDDPNTTDAYEGFIFDRNYDVGMLLFNHPLGSYDAFQTSLGRPAGVTAEASYDTEAISNVIYIAPQLRYQFAERWKLDATLLTAIINQDPLGGGTADDVGYELDVAITYKPSERITLKSEVGLLQPGDAFKGGANDYKSEFVYGITTKAAISF